MPAYPKPVRCDCPQCTALDPKGHIWPSASARNAHLASAKHRNSTTTATLATPPERPQNQQATLLEHLSARSPASSRLSGDVLAATPLRRPLALSSAPSHKTGDVLVPNPDLAPSMFDPSTPKGQVERADDPSDLVQLTDDSSLAEMSARIFVETLRSPTIGTRDNKVWPAPLHCRQINQSSQFLEANDQDIASLVSSFSQLNIESTSSQSPSPSPASTHALSTPTPSPSAEQTPTSTSTSSPRTPPTATRVNHLVTRQLRYIRNIEKLAEDLWKSLPISGNISLSVLSDVEARCSQLVTDLDKLKHTDPEVKRRRLAVADKLHNVEARAMDLRNAHTGGVLGPKVVCTDRQYNHPIEKLDNIAQMSILIGLVCSLFMGTSRRAGDFIMKSLSLLVATVYEAAGRPPPQTVLNQIPATITHALAQLNIESHTTIYAVCPRCCFTHPPKYHHNSTIATYPSTCTHKETSESDVCGEPLLTGRVNSGLSKPIKPFVYHHFSDYMAGLLSSKKDEESMDRACDDAFASVHEPPPERISNIFQGSFLRSFLGPDGKLFIDRGTEGRYVHSLNIDFFDAEGLTVRGASASWGLFSSACLNLSDSEMFKPEKMYVNIIPGPREPNVDQLNHFIRPFVDEMRASWEHGVYYTRTALHPEGRMARDAVACVVCDLLGARKAAGLASPNSHAYCSVCTCFNITTRGRYDFQNWVLRDSNAMREIARSYRDAPTTAERLKIFNQFKVRWSELWRLPYYDPIRQLVVDVMHAVYENWPEFFYRDTLKLTAKSANAPLKCIPAFKLAFPAPTQRQTENFGIDDVSRGQLKLISNALTIPFVLDSSPYPDFLYRLSPGDEGKLFIRPDGLAARLDNYKLPALRFATYCVLRTTEVPKSKPECISLMLDWRMRQILAPDLSLFEKRLSTPETMAHIQSVIKNTLMPSWFDKPPQAFGEAATGKLKADEWRSLSSIYLPLALVSLWGEGSQMDSHPDREYYQQVLNLSMLLASAMFLVSRRTTTMQTAEVYRRCISDWTKQFYEVFPTATLRTNLHMAFHIYEFLLLFGPAYSWWTFPFESLIGVIQRTKSNHKQGEMESTLVNSFIQAGILRRWLGRDDCPKPIREFKALFDRVFTPRRRNEVEEKGIGVGSRKQMMSCKTPTDLCAIVGAPRVVLRAYARHKGTILARASTHVGSSLVSFYPGGDTSVPPVPGSIQYIFEGESHCGLAIRRQRSLPASVADPFRHWPHVPITLYSAAMEPELEIVELDWVIGHVGRYPYSPELVAIIKVHRRD